MKVNFNSTDLKTIKYDPCNNCVFIRPEKHTCILLEFGEDNFDELPKCWNGIFIPEPLSHIFEL